MLENDHDQFDHIAFPPKSDSQKSHVAPKSKPITPTAVCEETGCVTLLKVQRRHGQQSD